jgi:hypothetical protein
MTEPDLDPAEERLRGERPVPSPGFRGNLRRRLSAQRPPAPTRPVRPGIVVAAYGGSGALLLALAAIGLAGVGPLAS